MKQAGWRFGLVTLAFSGVFLAGCRNEPEGPPRFSAEMYTECPAIERAWEPDYVGLAKRRFARGENVFLYKSPPEGGDTLYGGLRDAEGNVSEVARAAIAKGGSWGVTYPDTGCPNIPGSFEVNYMSLYNRFALTLYTAKR